MYLHCNIRDLRSPYFCLKVEKMIDKQFLSGPNTSQGNVRIPPPHLTYNHFELNGEYKVESIVV